MKYSNERLWKSCTAVLEELGFDRDSRAVDIVRELVMVMCQEESLDPPRKRRNVAELLEGIAQWDGKTGQGYQATIRGAMRTAYFSRAELWEEMGMTDDREPSTALFAVRLAEMVEKTVMEGIRSGDVQQGRAGGAAVGRRRN